MHPPSMFWVHGEQSKEERKKQKTKHERIFHWSPIFQATLRHDHETTYSPPFLFSFLIRHHLFLVCISK